MSRTRHVDPGERWAEFYLKNTRVLTAYALSLVGDATAAQELIQDVLVRMVEQDRPVHDARSYVLRSLRNLAIDRRRAAGSLPAIGPLDEAHVTTAFLDQAEPGESLARREELQRVRSALETLPADRREVIVLKIYAELTFREIAHILGAPLGTVTSIYARGLDELRGLLKEHRELRHVV